MFFFLTFVEVCWLHGQCPRLWIEWSGFKPWPGSLCCVLKQHFTITVLLLTQVYKWVPARMLGVTLPWTSILSRGE